MNVVTGEDTTTVSKAGSTKLISAELYPAEFTKTSIRVKNPSNLVTEMHINVTGKVIDFIILDNMSITLKPGEETDLIIGTYIPEETPSGTYYGGIILSLAGTTYNIPVNIRVLATREKLLDIKISPLTDVIEPGDKLGVETIIYNLDETKRLDVQLDLQLIDINTNEIIVETSDDIVVATTITQIEELDIPRNIKEGKYILKGTARYTTDDKVRETSNISYLTIRHKFITEEYKPTFDVSQYSTIFIAFALIMVLVFLIIAFKYSNKSLVVSSFKDTYHFLCKNPSIFLIGLLLSIIILSINLGVDSLKPVPPSIDDFKNVAPIEYQIVTSKYMITTIPFLILAFVIQFFITTYFTAVVYCFIRNPLMGDAFSKARRFYIRIIFAGIALGLITIALFIPLSIIFFIGVAIAFISSISVILYILNLLLYSVGLLIIFAVILKLGFTIPIIVYENGGVIESLEKSWKLTKGFILSIFVVILIPGIVLYLPIVIPAYLLPKMGGHITNFLMYFYYLPIMYSLTVMLYLNIKKVKYEEIK